MQITGSRLDGNHSGVQKSAKSMKLWSYTASFLTCKYIVVFLCMTLIIDHRWENERFLTGRVVWPINASFSANECWLVSEGCTTDHLHLRSLWHHIYLLCCAIILNTSFQKILHYEMWNMRSIGIHSFCTHLRATLPPSPSELQVVWTPRGFLRETHLPRLEVLW